MTLAIAEDGMCHATTRSNQGLLWCVSVRPPKGSRVKNGAFWANRIGGSEDDARFGGIHPFMAHFNNPGHAAVPYVGLVAILKGRKGVRAFEHFLRSVGAEIA